MGITMDLEYLGSIALSSIFQYTFQDQPMSLLYIIYLMSLMTTSILVEHLSKYCFDLKNNYYF